MRNRARIGLLFIGAMAIGAEAYAMPESRGAPGTFPVSVPFALDAVGNSITIPFDVNSGNVGAKRHLMIGLDVAHAPDSSAVDDIRLHTRLLRVRVVYDDHGTHVPIETEDTETIIAGNTGKPRPPCRPDGVPSPSLCRCR